MIGNAELKIHVPNTFYAGEVTSGRCVSNVNDFNSIFVIMTVTSDGNCTVNRSREIETVGKHYQMNFTINCASGNHTVSCIYRVLFLNQAWCAGHRPARAWFLEIAFVHASVCVCLSVCPPPRPLITSSVMWYDINHV